ncbi:hypothetical protein SAMN05444679_10621 [Variovorax sp. CF079]|uniref:hypothetical protein n=1 Tax=Variovorax sp. CF079 TaxID=1882774 RepID=UPI0008890454|nr:hypothetical protein [Variovorax sp. CF079]SDC89320.1 hypothetical protein SAMN05444679_10621 [Variovorax sp. CF079]
MLFSFRPRFAALALAAAALGACSPVFNWREVPIGDDGLIALLPCKADRATRMLPLGAELISVDVTGCEAGGATFAVAHAAASDAAQAESWMRAWRAATRTQLAGAPMAEAPAVLPRATDSPGPMRLETQAGASAPTHVLWFAQQRAGKMALYQATVLGKPSSPEARAIFFEGLRLP